MQASQPAEQFFENGMTHEIEAAPEKTAKRNRNSMGIMPEATILSEEKQKKKNQKIDVISLKRKWNEEQERLTKEKEVLGFGDCPIKDFLSLEMDEDETLIKTDAIISLQNALRTQQEERGEIWGDECAVEELNAEYAIVHTSQFYILREKEHPVYGIDFTLESKQSLKDTFENQIVLCSDGKMRTKAEVWLKSPMRRQYDGIVFNPDKKAVSSKYYNLWRGFSIAPKKGSCERYKAHVREVICNDNKAYFKYTWKWSARLIQAPHLLAESAIVLMGDPGAGKNSFVEPLGDLLGSHYLPLDSMQQLLGNFNFHLKNAVLIHGNEALWGGNKKDLGKLKAMITEKHKLIEGKGKDQIIVPNFTHLIVSSNEDWPVYIDPNDRRFFVLQVSNKHKEDLEYFGLIRKELENGGLQALLYELLYEDISDFDPRRIPTNVEAFSVKLTSCGSIERYLYEALNTGFFNIGNGAPTGDWKKNISTNSVYSDYAIWCSMGGHTQENDAIFGKVIKKLLPSTEKIRPRVGDVRANQYVFPDLSQTRKEFEKSFKIDDSIWNSWS